MFSSTQLKNILTILLLLCALSSSLAKIDSSEKEKANFKRVSQEVEALVHSYTYKEAISLLKKCHREVSSQKLQKKIETQIQKLKPKAYLMELLIKGINSGKLANYEVPLGGQLKGKFLKADDKGYVVKIQQGSIKQKWSQLSIEKIADLFFQVKVRSCYYTTGAFCFENGLEKSGNKSFIRYLKSYQKNKKQHSQAKQRVDRYLALYYKIKLPPEGFVPYQDMLVTKKEKDFLDKGLVKYGKKWVTLSDKKQLEKGLKKYQGKWVKAGEADLLAQGYEQHKNKWYSREEIQKIRAQWENAWTKETRHYSIRTNISGEFTEEVALLLEAAYQKYERFFGFSVQKKMSCFLFRNFNDYKNYSLENDLHKSLTTMIRGYAHPRTNTLYAYLPEDDRFYSLKSTILHEASHLYHADYNNNHNVRYKLPTWYTEGTATLFEEFDWDGKTLTIKRNDRLLKEYQEQGDKIHPLSHLTTEAGSLAMRASDKSYLYYSQWWAICYFFHNTKDMTLKKSFQELEKKMNTTTFSRDPDCFVTYYKGQTEAIDKKMKAFYANIDF